MSTSWLYHGFGVRGYRYVKTEYVWGGMVITMERPWQACRCVACGSENVWRHGWVVRRFRTVPIGRALPVGVQNLGVAGRPGPRGVKKG